MAQSKIKRKPDILKKFHKVKIGTEGITAEQKRSPKFQSAYQDMLRQLTAPRFADVLCCHEAAHLFYFKLAGGAKDYKAFPASLRYDPAIDDFAGSLASIQPLGDIPKAATMDELQQEMIPKVAKAHAAGGVVARKLMADHPVHGYDASGGDQDDKERFTELCRQLNAKANTALDAETLWKSAQGAVDQDDVTGKICTRWNERESTWRKSGSCQSRGTNQSRS
jgi:hypothetical protein